MTLTNQLEDNLKENGEIMTSKNSQLREEILNRLGRAYGADEQAEAMVALVLQAVDEALDLFEHRIDCDTVISELYGWKSIVAMAKDETYIQLGLRGWKSPYMTDDIPDEIFKRTVEQEETVNTGESDE